MKCVGLRDLKCIDLRNWELFTLQRQQYWIDFILYNLELAKTDKKIKKSMKLVRTTHSGWSVTGITKNKVEVCIYHMPYVFSQMLEEAKTKSI